MAAPRFQTPLLLESVSGGQVNMLGTPDGSKHVLVGCSRCVLWCVVFAVPCAHGQFFNVLQSILDL